MRTELYKRATFVTHLPVSHLYTVSHNWIAAGEGSGPARNWRVGYTKFALRMLGELVDVRLEAQRDSSVQVGDIIGSIEGFKAISDIYAVGTGQFVTGNAALASGLGIVAKTPYEAGWLYEFAGEPDSRAMDMNGYRALLDATIDRMLEKQRQEEKT